MVTEEMASLWPVKTLEAALGCFFGVRVESVPLVRKKAGIITDYWRETAEDDSESCRQKPAGVVVNNKVVTQRCRDGGGEALARMGPVEIARNAGSRYKSERLPSAFLTDENIPK